MVHSFYSSDQPSGENTVVLNEVDALRRAGHEVALFAAYTDQLEGEVFYRIRAGIRVATGYGRNPLAAINDFGPDVIHVHNLFPNWGTRWLVERRRPVVHTVHNYRPLCANGMLFMGGDVCLRCPTGSPWSGVRLGCYGDSRLRTLPVAMGQSAFSGHAATLREADKLLFVSDGQRTIFAEAGVLTGLDTAVAPNFLPNTHDPGFAPAFEADPYPFWVVAGRLSGEKGIAELVASWGTDEPILEVFGNGPLAKRVRGAARGRAVRIRGSVPRSRLLSRMRRAIGTLVPSLWMEPFGLTYIESIAGGTPVVAMEGIPTADLIVGDGTGDIIPSLADLPRLVRDTAGFTEHRRRCRSVFERKYSERAYLERAVAMYVALAEKGQR